MKLKTKAIENYMTLGGSLPPLSHLLFSGLVCLSLELGLPVPCPCPLFWGLLGPLPHAQVPLGHQPFLVFLSVLVGGGQDSSTRASVRPGLDLAGAAERFRRDSQRKGRSAAWECVREAEEEGEGDKLQITSQNQRAPRLNLGEPAGEKWRRWP